MKVHNDWDAQLRSASPISISRDKELGDFVAIFCIGERKVLAIQTVLP